MTLGDMLDAYQRDVLAQKPAAEDTATMIAAIKRARLPIPSGAQAFGDWLVNDVSEAQLWAYRTARSRKIPARRRDGTEYRRLMGGAVAVNRDLQLIRRAYNWALSARPDDVHTSPFKAGKPPKGLFTSERPRGRRLQGDEADRLLRACGTTLRPLVEAALETGCRQGELLTLQWGEVNLRDVKPEIRLTAEKTKTRTDRTIPISTRLRPILEMRRNDAEGEPHPPDAYVFGHPATGEPLTTIKTAWRLAMKRSGIPDLHFHDLRREAASRWLDSGMRLTAIQRLLGHTTTEQTATYLASALNAEHDAIAAFDAHREAERERALARQREAEARLQVFANEVGEGVQNGAKRVHDRRL